MCLHDIFIEERRLDSCDTQGAVLGLFGGSGQVHRQLVRATGAEGEAERCQNPGEARQ